MTADPSAQVTKIRYTDRPLPPYRFVPGQAPHPTRDPQGHSYNQRPERLVAFEDEDWCDCDEYLYGIDLFNHEYWWEAHEALEAVWVAAGRRTETGLFIQGLIQIAVAHLKWFQEFHDTCNRMALDGLGKIPCTNVIRLGIELATFRDDVEAYFAGKSATPVNICLCFPQGRKLSKPATAAIPGR